MDDMDKRATFIAHPGVRMFVIDIQLDAQNVNQDFGEINVTRIAFPETVVTSVTNHLAVVYHVLLESMVHTVTWIVDFAFLLQMG